MAQQEFGDPGKFAGKSVEEMQGVVEEHLVEIGQPLLPTDGQLLGKVADELMLATEPGEVDATLEALESLSNVADALKKRGK